MKHIYNLKFVFSLVAVLFLSSGLFAQQVAVTEDGREIYLQSDLDKMPIEKREAITQSENAIVIDSKEELGSYQLYTEKLKVAEQNKKSRAELAETKRDLKEKVRNGEISESKAKSTFQKNTDNVEMEEKVRSGNYSEDEIAEMKMKASSNEKNKDNDQVERQEDLNEKEILLGKKKNYLEKMVKSGKISKSQAETTYNEFKKSLDADKVDSSHNSK